MLVFWMARDGDLLLLGSTSLAPTDRCYAEVGTMEPDQPGARSDVGWVYRVQRVFRDGLLPSEGAPAIVLQPGEPTAWLPDFQPGDGLLPAPEDLGGA